MIRTCFNTWCQNEVEDSNGIGRAPMCLDCKEKGRVAYNQRQRDQRATKPKLPRNRSCCRCGELYLYTPKRGFNKGLCGPCVPLLAAEEREERLERRRQRYKRRAEDESFDEKRVRRFKERMTKFGLDIPDNVDAITCGICNSPDPGYSFWHIDHDHRCCPDNKACSLCFRGLLCGKCNTGIGQFNEDIVRLSRAIEWLTR